MDISIYIIGDLPISLTEKEYSKIFSKEQIAKLENDEEIEWANDEGQIYKVKIVKT